MIFSIKHDFYTVLSAISYNIFHIVDKFSNTHISLK